MKLIDLADTAFNIENQLTSNIGLDFISFYKATSLYGFYFIVLKFLIKGFNVYIIFAMKIGLPIASCGLMDSDSGVYKPFIKKFIQEILSVLVQILFLKISIALMINGNILFGLAGIAAAVKTPQFLQEFIMMYGGGQGVVSKTTQTLLKDRYDRWR